ncbi:MAG: glycosyltransferase family 4 protein [Planctomycetota bacterium]|jgi:glycosyltransferase involved in cell wall biosynthesis
MERIVLMAPKLELRGSTVYTLMMARELKLRGYRVTVMAGEGSYADDLAAEKIPFLRADISEVFVRDLLYLNQYVKQLRPLNPELIHVTHHNLAALGGWIADRLRIPYIVTVQSILKKKLSYQPRFLQGAVAISQPVRQSMVNIGRVPRERAHIIPNGVVTGLKPPERKSAGLIPVVGTVGRLEKDRGIKYFIHAARELISRNVQAHFLIMGIGPEETKLRKLIRRLEITEHITINAALSKFKDLMNPIDIFVSPALSEGFGIFVLHAMASAVPVVASAAGGVFSLINDNITGLIVPKRDISFFADKIQAFLDDRAFAEEIGNNGFNYVQINYPFKKTLEGTLNLYHEHENGGEDLGESR